MGTLFNCGRLEAARALFFLFFAALFRTSADPNRGRNTARRLEQYTRGELEVNCVVTVSVYSPASSSAGIRRVSSEGLLVVIKSSSSFVSVPSASVRVTPTDGSSPATFSMAPRTKRFRPAVALPSLRPVLRSSVSMMYITFAFSPKISTLVSAIALCKSRPCVKET